MFPIPPMAGDIMPSTGFHASLHERPIRHRLRWLFASMPAGVTRQTSGGDVGRAILAAITSRL